VSPKVGDFNSTLFFSKIMNGVSFYKTKSSSDDKSESKVMIYFVNFFWSITFFNDDYLEFTIVSIIGPENCIV